jgi:hypothetical protein
VFGFFITAAVILFLIWRAHGGIMWRGWKK